MLGFTKTDRPGTLKKELIPGLELIASWDSPKNQYFFTVNCWLQADFLTTKADKKEINKLTEVCVDKMVKILVNALRGIQDANKN